MAHETRISPEIETTPDWAAAVRRADGWVSEFLVANPRPRASDWSVRAGPGGEPLFTLLTSLDGMEFRTEYTRGELGDKWDSVWRFCDARRETTHQAIRAEYAGIKQLLR